MIELEMTKGGIAKIPPLEFWYVEVPPMTLHQS